MKRRSHTSKQSALECKLVGMLQYDVRGSSQLAGSKVILQEAKERLMRSICATVELYGGVLQSSAGDGAVFFFPVDKPSECPCDWVVLAALHALRTVEFLNESWNPFIKLASPLSVRLSCHRGEVLLDPADQQGAHGADLDWFIKGERDIALPDAVTITSPLQMEISPSLANLFDLREKPYSRDVRGRTVSWALYSYAKTPIHDQVVRISWDEYWKALTELADDLSGSRDKNSFKPDLIVAISRGGAAFGDFLSVLLKDTPLITLWAEREEDTEPAEVVFEHPSNPFNTHDLAGIIRSKGVRRILLVDDFLKSSKSIVAARRWIEDQLKKLPEQERQMIEMRTAVIAKNAKFDASREFTPDFIKFTNKTHLPYWKG